MVHVHGDNALSPPSAENPATPRLEADPVLLTPNRREFDAEYSAWSPLPPSAVNFQYAEKSRFPSLQSLRAKLASLRFKPPRSKPPFQGFERPSYSRIAILTILCFITYPAFYILTLVAKDRSLFTVRLFVSTWCAMLGFALGYILLGIGARHLEATTWATMVHMSHEGRGMKLRDLARSSRAGFMSPFYIIWSRFCNRENDRRSRRSYDKRPWSLFLGYFIVLTTLAPLLPFIFGRIIVIEVSFRDQNEVYKEISIPGDISDRDVDQAIELQSDPEETLKTLYLFPYGRGASMPTTGPSSNDLGDVYFAQPISLSGVGGPGTFYEPELLQKTPKNTLFMDRSAVDNVPGVIVRYPQWGVRIHCAGLLDPKVNLIPLSSQNFTYVLVPRDLLEGLFEKHGVGLPTQFTESDLKFLDANDTIPPNINRSTISYHMRSPDNGQGISLHSIFPDGASDQGSWMTVETVLVRFNTGLTPNAQFPVHANTTRNGWVSNIGYDAAVCVQKYEPWIVEAYYYSFIDSGYLLRIVGGGDGSRSLSPSGRIRGPPITKTRYLSTTGKGATFNVSLTIRNNQLTRDITYRSHDYTPSPTAIYFSTGFHSYRRLDPDKVGRVLADYSAGYALPYLVGSGDVVAQYYEDETVARTTYKKWQLIGPLLGILILGIIGELFVPVLPGDIPRREFGIYSWLALLQYQELQLIEAADDLDKFMDLDELEEKLSSKRVKFATDRPTDPSCSSPPPLYVEGGDYNHNNL